MFPVRASMILFQLFNFSSQAPSIDPLCFRCPSFSLLRCILLVSLWFYNFLDGEPVQIPILAAYLLLTGPKQSRSAALPEMHGALFT
ncbi:hypothetical protein B0T17DRAFT_111287 [Bombardia bombarda]|uniref:Uncharacterized protein n=1 Tax=Bombardia bombarda TaxID=252184 RepID=A0AA39TGT1_9PEZI|nr:hypothetical protein B0T17DRAFT_111287 [Bombardia bombarda]